MEWVIANINTIVHDTVVHMALSIVPIVVGALISIPSGLAINKMGKYRKTMVSFISSWYVIPSLPLLVVLPAIVDTKILDPINLEVVLSFYAISLMASYGADALYYVDQDLIITAKSLGFTPWQVFYHVQLPQACHTLISGLRVVAVSTISLVTIGTLIGIPSLGDLFTEGYQRAFPTEIITAIVLVMLIALIVDGFLLFLRHMFSPKKRKKFFASSDDVSSRGATQRQLRVRNAAGESESKSENDGESDGDGKGESAIRGEEAIYVGKTLCRYAADSQDKYEKEHVKSCGYLCDNRFNALFIAPSHTSLKREETL